MGGARGRRRFCHSGGASLLCTLRPGTIPRVRIWSESLNSIHGAPDSNMPMVRFWFEDNGIGIPSEYHERIFDMFQQLDKSYEGTGIGLALVRKTAERMGGHVGVVSTPGQGSRFWLELKMVTPPIK